MRRFRFIKAGIFDSTQLSCIKISLVYLHFSASAKYTFDTWMMPPVTKCYVSYLEEDIVMHNTLTDFQILELIVGNQMAEIFWRWRFMFLAINKPNSFNTVWKKNPKFPIWILCDPQNEPNTSAYSTLFKAFMHELLKYSTIYFWNILHRNSTLIFYNSLIVENTV